MPPRAATVGRAVTGLATMSVVRRNAGADRAGGCGFHSDRRFLTSLRRSRGRVLFVSIKRTLEGGIHDD